MADQGGGEPKPLAAARAAGREAVRARWQIARLSPAAGTTLIATLGAVNLALGVLPVLFVLETSTMLGRVPAAVDAGVGSAAWGTLLHAFLLAVCAFSLAQLLAPLQVALSDLAARRVDGAVFARLMSASLRQTGIAALEDPELLDDLSEAAWQLENGNQSPGRAVAGLLALTTRYTQLGGYVLCIAVDWSWPAAACILLTTLLFRYGQRGGLRRYTAVFRRLAHVRRRTWYLRDLAAHAPAAKEIRVFGLVDLLRTRYRAQYRAFLEPVWAERHRVYLAPYFVYCAIGVALAAGVMASVGTSAAGGADVARLALVLQSALAAIRLGDFYPEADTQTQGGMLAFKGITAFEHGAARHAAAESRPADGAADTADATDAANAANDAGPAQQIAFRSVGFRYPGSTRPVLHGLDLTLAAGRCTAVVGLNGAGKTTLVKLLARLYEPTSGAIEVDGRDLSARPVDAWRGRLAVIFQDFLHFEASAADNIGFGAIGYRDDRTGIVAAAQAAGIRAAIEALPAGFDTPLSRTMAGGAELSGGQWQRIALARAMFALRHGATVLVLDEPTANLDVRAEARFYDDLIRAAPGVTVILISHRFATVRRADTIVVLEEGRVLEQGPHEELMARDGRYAQLFRIQAERFADSDYADGSADPNEAAPAPNGDGPPRDPDATRLRVGEVQP